MSLTLSLWKYFLATILTLLFGFLLTGCSASTTPSTDTSNTAGTTTAERTTYEDQQQTRFDDLAQKTSNFKVRVTEAEKVTNPPVDLTAQVNTLNQKMSAAQTALNQLQTATVDTWEDAKAQNELKFSDWDQAYITAKAEAQKHSITITDTDSSAGSSDAGVVPTSANNTPSDLSPAPLY